MSTDNLDELELPRNRPTDPAPPMTDREMLESIQELLAGMASDMRSMASTVAALAGTISVAIEQGQSFNRRVSDLEQRVAKLESQRSPNGSTIPQEGP